VESTPPSQQHARLAVKGLRHSYGKGVTRREILHGLDMEFRSGEIVIIIGPSGSGKSTFLSLAGALRSVQEGSVQVEGVELRGAKAEDLTRVRRGIGFIFQSHNLLASLNCRQNVQISMACDLQETAASARAKAVLALAEVGLAQLQEAWPHELSVGERQRVAVARALVHGPRIILADEPTASLDRAAGKDVVDLLHAHARQRGCAILLVTHDQRILEAADRILRMEDGRLA
jgi:putative ABC transport system ATP-binding protein